MAHIYDRQKRTRGGWKWVVVNRLKTGAYLLNAEETFVLVQHPESSNYHGDTK
jgi:hypothetical protein